MKIVHFEPNLGINSALVYCFDLFVHMTVFQARPTISTNDEEIIEFPFPLKAMLATLLPAFEDIFNAEIKSILFSR